MGNCQAAEAATVVIQHPGNQRTDRIYWSVSAQEIMSANPGHYVALVLNSTATFKTPNGTPIRHLKLLRPDDTLLLGHVYRLVTVQDVLKEFNAKKCSKLGKLLKEGGALSVGMKMKDVSDSASNPNENSKSQNNIKAEHRSESSGAGSGGGRGGGGQRVMGRHHGGGSQWRPALKSIAEVGINI